MHIITQVMVSLGLATFAFYNAGRTLEFQGMVLMERPIILQGRPWLFGVSAILMVGSLVEAAALGFILFGLFGLFVFPFTVVIAMNILRGLLYLPKYLYYRDLIPGDWLRPKLWLVFSPIFNQFVFGFLLLGWTIYSAVVYIFKAL